MAMFETNDVVGGGDHSWLGSRHGVNAAESGTLNATAFADTLDGDVVPSGTPVSEDAEGLLIPYNGTLRGFVLYDHSLSGSGVVPVLWHGRVNRDRLPVEFTEPTNAHQFVFEPPFPVTGGSEA